MKIAALCPKNASTESYQNFLTELKESHEIYYIDSMEKLKNLLTLESLDLITLYMSQVSRQNLKYIESIRRTFKLSVILLTDKIKTQELEVVRENPSYYLLDMPYKVQDFVGIAKKMIEKQHISQRHHTRYNTTQDMALSDLASGKNSKATLLDLSKSGARVQIASSSRHIELGSLVKLDIALNELDKTHSLHAKVVWANPANDTDTQMGLEFVPADEVYQHLLGNI